MPGGASIKNITHLLLPSEGTTDQGRGFKEEESRPSSMLRTSENSVLANLRELLF
jgi:hypothetical protein